MIAIRFRNSGRQGASSGPARDRKRRPSVEALEGRELMSIGPEFLTPVNTTTRLIQSGSDNATSAGGASVVVWTDEFSPLDHDIRAQRFNSFGGRMGPEILVSFSNLDEGSPHVAMDDRGRFVVTWVQALSGGDTNVVARRFDSNGNPAGDLIQVGAGTFQEIDPDVAMDLTGNFVVSYTRNTNNNNPDIFAKRYNSDGQLLNVVNVATSLNAEIHSRVAMTPDGRFDVAWEQAYGANDHDIYLNRYSATGGLLGTQTISFSASNDASPSVAVDNLGNGVVGWEQAGDIKARRFTAAGTVGSEINIASSANLERHASVALKPGGGGFVVAYDSTPSYVFNLSYRVAEVSAFDTVTTVASGFGAEPAVSIDAFNDYLMTSTTLERLDSNISGRRGLLLF
jgi:hypothetical protein